jgi:hypothetical protein
MHGFHNGCLVEWKNVTFVYNGQSHCVRIKGQPWPVFFWPAGEMTSAQNKWPFSFFPSASEDAKLTCDSVTLTVHGFLSIYNITWKLSFFCIETKVYAQPFVTARKKLKIQLTFCVSRLTRHVHGISQVFCTQPNFFNYFLVQEEEEDNSARVFSSSVFQSISEYFRVANLASFLLLTELKTKRYENVNKTKLSPL